VISMRRYERFRTVLIFLLFALTVPLARAAGTTTYVVTLNTAPLVAHPAGPFSILFALTDGSGLADGNNTISVTNVDFGGGNGLGSVTVFGGASGSLESGLTITDTSPLNLFSEGFSPGQVLRFTVTLTTNDDGGGTPDRITFYVLDASGTPVPTLAPAADYLLGIDLGSAPSAPAAFGTDPSRSPSNGNPIAISAPTLSTDTTPPVTTASVSPAPNGNGWNNTNITVTLNSTDNELGGTGVKQVTYSASGAQTIATTVMAGASTSFTISSEGITTITFFGTDNAGNVELAKIVTLKIDETPPSITVFGKILTSRQEEEGERRVVQIAISGKIADSTSGVDTASAAYVISDEDGIPQTRGALAPAADGTYSLIVSFKKTRHRKDEDERDQRRYKLTVSAKDNAGNQGSSSTLVDRDDDNRDRHD
jgi:hypothetical protein